MKELKVPVSVYLVKAFCECGGYFYVDESENHMSLDTFPPTYKYPHRCSKCNKLEYFNKKYPFPEYKELWKQ